MKKILKFLAIIVIALVLILGLTIASCSIPHYLKEAEENQKPLLKAIKDWAEANPDRDHDTSPAVLKFIPVGTSQTEALRILKQNGFQSQCYEQTKQTQLMRAIYTRSDAVCRRDYEIFLELKANKVTKSSGDIHFICL